MALLSSWHFKLLLVGAWLLLVAKSTLAAMTPFAAIDPILQGCTDEDAAHVHQAWKEAGDLANVHYEWSPGGAWQAAMDLYLGNATRKDYDFWGDPGPLVAENIVRDWLVHFAGYGDHPRNTYAWIYCHQDYVPGFDPRYPSCEDGDYAMTWNKIGWFWTTHYVVLCPSWWNFTETSSLAELTRAADGEIKSQRTMEYWKPNRARSLHHETYHWEDTVSVPKCLDLDYEPQEICDTAYYYGTEEARWNAESFSLAALAIYVQKTFHLDSPPTPFGVPYVPLPNGLSKTGKDGNDSLSSEPVGWVSPVSMDSQNFTWWDVSGTVALSSYGNITEPSDE